MREWEPSGCNSRPYSETLNRDDPFYELSYLLSDLWIRSFDFDGAALAAVRRAIALDSFSALPTHGLVDGVTVVARWSTPAATQRTYKLKFDYSRLKSREK